MAQPPSKCGECRRLMNNPQLSIGIEISEEDIAVMVSDFLEDSEKMGKQAKKRDKKSKREVFLKNVNAVLNHGAGLIIVHVKNPYNLDTFEQSVNNQMAALIPDDSPFYENFERHIVGRNHLIFRVIPKERKLSTLFFNTKVPQSCCVEDPTQGQMRYLMEHQGGQGKDPLYKLVNFKFRQDQPVEVQVQKVSSGKAETPKDSVFQEAINIQAKKVPASAIEQFQPSLESEFFSKTKPGTYLPKYVTAFTKLPQGGSIFLGIKEGKETSPKWEEVEGEEKDQVLNSLNENLRLWKGKGDDSGLYYVAEESQQKEVESGQYMCEGVKLDPQHEEAVSQDIKRLIKENTYWLPNTEQPPVDVVYHRVEDNKQFCVVEIKVNRYKRMVFHDEAGPQAYKIRKIDGDGCTELGTMSQEDWSDNFKQ